ncbi:phage major capsid protein [Micromonospora avicenniae]|uniref:Phage major capsid protein, HK97 family n=1 Tax=Micromonospora avicenniae TaxID=1198245 RepID=A0A1N6YF10_9ACTN|nr:phage major capsid protein [Micromonospora avicenniae]SIR13109.1 phage major capsid protein, HK97 family [Micromonospora avicenniae]
MDRNKLVARNKTITDEAREILDAVTKENPLTDEQRAELDRLDTELRANEAALEVLNEREEQDARLARVNASRAQYGTQRTGHPGDISSSFGGSTRDQAKRTLDTLHRSGQLPDHAAEKATDLVTKQGTARDQDVAARWVVVAGNEAYRSAFGKMLADPQKGHMLWTPQEQEAYRQAEQLRVEMRANMAEATGGAGGYMVPVVLDPAIMLSSSGSINPLRRISRVVQTVGSQWSGITSTGISAEWLGADNTARAMSEQPPVVANPNIPVFLGDAFVPYSYEIGMDIRDFQAEITKLTLDAADQLMNTAYTTGTGVGQPKGLITALVAAGGSSVVASGTADTFKASDVYALQNAQAPRFSARSEWVAALPTINTMAQMETTAGARLFPELGSGRLLNRSIHELSNMDGAVNATQENYILAYGDFSNFVIVDRIGTTIELIPNLMDPATGRPSGKRGLVLYFRTGSDVVVPNAFRLLNVT